MSADGRAIRLGTRGSALALAQANWVVSALTERHFDVETVVVRTAADMAPQLPLSAFGDKAVWVAGLEQQLLGCTIDVAVHSMKDVPAELAPGLVLEAVPERECPLDALILPASHPGIESRFADPTYASAAAHYSDIVMKLNELLPHRARVGTSSDRRKAQILVWRPDLCVLPVRGNVDTRLRKLDEGDFDALVLAAAGLRRLGSAGRITALFPARMLLPAAGQGALALEIRAGDDRLRLALATLNHGPTAAAVAAERAFVRGVAGGCSLPLGVYTAFDENCLELFVRAVDPNPAGAPPIQDLQSIDVPDEDPFADLTWAREFGQRVADRFLKNGGQAFLDRLGSVD